MKLVTLKKQYEFLLKDTITEYLSPNYIYLPIYNDSKFKVNPKSYIYRGQLIYDLKYSSISGKILGLKEYNSINGMSKFLLIENDFKEKTEKRLGIRKQIANIPKSELIDLLSVYDTNLVNEINKSYKKIIINSIEEQPYVGNKMFINTKYGKEVLDLVDALGEILDIKDIQYMVKDTDYNSITSLNNIIAMYTNINLRFIPDKYMISNRNVLNRYLNIKDDYLYIDVEEAYDLYQYLKRKKIKEEQFITITGDAIDNPQVIKCKVGTSLPDLMNDVIKINTNDFVVIPNSLLSNKEINYNGFIITPELKSVYIMKKSEIKESPCINCGKCNEICPLRIKVSNLVDKKPCDLQNCIHCGLCSYICPSYININRYLDGDRNE